MLYEKTDFAFGNATLEVYKPDGVSDNEAILVIPGGGYSVVCHDREGEPIALAFVAQGFTAFVLKSYSIGADAAGHTPLVEASAAMAYIRRNAERFKINKNKVYATGFSAGGHLAGSLAVLWHRNEVVKNAEIEYGENRPDAVALCYPVISGLEMGHKGSFYNILSTKAPTDEQLRYYSLELHVDEKSSPAFIMHTANDQVVPVQNAICMADSYASAKVPFELHIYPDAPHGLALANEITWIGNPDYIRPQAARWVADAVYFFKHL